MINLFRALALQIWLILSAKHSSEYPRLKEHWFSIFFPGPITDTIWSPLSPRPPDIVLNIKSQTPKHHLTQLSFYYIRDGYQRNRLLCKSIEHSATDRVRKFRAHSLIVSHQLLQSLWHFHQNSFFQDWVPRTICSFTIETHGYWRCSHMFTFISIAQCLLCKCRSWE